MKDKVIKTEGIKIAIMPSLHTQCTYLKETYETISAVHVIYFFLEGSTFRTCIISSWTATT